MQQQKSRKIIARKLSAKGNDILKLAKSARLKIKTAQDNGGELGPDDVAEILEEVVMPAVEAIADAGNAIVEGIPGGESSLMDTLGNQDDSPITDDVSPLDNSDDDEEEDENEDRIAKLEASNKILMDENISMHKARLAKEYGDIFNYRRTAAEKEILDSTDSLDTLKVKVASAKQTAKTFGEAGLIKTSTPYRTASLRTAKAGSQLPWSARL